MKNKLLITFFIFLLGFLAGWTVKTTWPSSQTALNEISPLRENSKEAYKFINPLLAVDTPEVTGVKGLESLKAEVQNFIDRQITGGDAIKIATFFREPTLSRWFAINENEKFNPASLLKVPKMIAYFKMAESDPAILSKKLFYDGSFDANQNEHFRAKEVIQPRHWYTIAELIRSLIVSSDNNATRLLEEGIDKKIFKDTYTDLRLTVPVSNAVDAMTVRDYSYFFRVLYNATYLNHVFSEKALELLSEPDFPNGIRNAVSAGVPVAQKFGERVISHLTSAGDIVDDYKELHDCGIIYYPQHPYLLCIMTKGQDFDKLASAIQEISRLVYSWVDKHK